MKATNFKLEVGILMLLLIIKMHVLGSVIV